MSEEKLKNTARIEWVDCTKGIAIVLVVLGYFSPNLDIGVRIIYSFHMPLFFIMTGFVSTSSYRNPNYLEFVEKKAIRLMKPYCLYGVILLMFKIVKSALSEFGGALNLNTFLNTLLVTRKSFISELWFLPCLFVTHCLIYWMVRIKKHELKWVIALIFSWVVVILRNKINVAFPMNLDNALLAIPFVLLGMELRKWKSVCEEYLANRRIVFAIWISFFTMCWYESKTIDYVVYFSDLLVGNFILLWGTAIIGSAMVIATAQLLIKCKNSFLEKLGEDSLKIYGMHYCVLAVVFQILKPFIQNYRGAKMLLFAVVETIIVICLIEFADIVIGNMRKRENSLRIKLKQ